MVWHKEYEDHQEPFDFNFEEDYETLSHKKKIRRRLEDRFDRRSLKHELEDYEGELDDEFDWGDQSRHG